MLAGLFYVSATHEALRLMQRLAQRMAREDVWDQSAYNRTLRRTGPSAAEGVEWRAARAWQGRGHGRGGGPLALARQGHGLYTSHHHSANTGLTLVVCIWNWRCLFP